MQSPRAGSVSARIRTIVAEILENKIKDPRLGFVTVTEVKITGDLREATIFYTVLGDDVAKENSAKALKSAKGFIRSELGKYLGIKHTPSLDFEFDAVIDYANNMNELLDEVTSLDEKKTQEFSEDTK